MLSRRRFVVVAVGMLATALAACAAAARSILPGWSPTPTPSAPPQSSATRPPTATSGPSVTGPSLREKIGQMLVVGFRGRTAKEADATLRQVSEVGIGGVVLFSVDHLTGGPRNVESPEQLASLVGSLANAATVAPLLVSIDQEGGRVARLTPAYGFPTPAPSAAELGALDDPALTRAEALGMAEVLAAVGVTLNLAPVVDLATNPGNPIIAGLERSYGVDPQLVTSHAAAFIEAQHDAGLRSALKHFPGHGSSAGDTHLGVVDVTETWRTLELEPFAALIDRGLADAVLTAHVFNATLDPQHPATLSRATIGGILRDRLGFDGPVLSDDLQMGAIRDAYGYPEAVARAIEAGIDLLVIANQLVYEPDIAPHTVDLIEELVRSGRIDEGRIEDSWRRVARLKGTG